MSESPIRCLLWDFGDTLANERWMLRHQPDLPLWTGIWQSVVRGPLVDAWHAGDIDGQRIALELARRLGISPEAARDRMAALCGEIHFLASTMGLARKRVRPQALVTVNPDLFSDFVVGPHQLDSWFDVIVTSWEERTLDKGALCHAALERMEGTFAPEEALLIDNRADCVDSWRARGGRAYHYTGEVDFGRALGEELAELDAAGR